MRLTYYHTSSIAHGLIYGLVFFLLMLPMRTYELTNRMNIENTWAKATYFILLFIIAFTSVYVYKSKIRNGIISFYKVLYISILTILFGMLADNILMETVAFIVDGTHTWLLSAFSFLIVLFFGVLLGLTFGSIIALFLASKEGLK